MHTALSLPSHGEQEVSLCSYRSAALTAHSCVCACMRRCRCHRVASRLYVSALIGTQRSQLIRVYVHTCRAALFLPSHGEQAVSVRSYNRTELTTHSLCMLPSHGEQRVSFCCYRRAAFTAHSCVYVHACGAALSLPSHGEQRVSRCSYRRAALTAHSCVCACMRRCLCHRMANRL
jgi:hypothetical protein